MVITMTDQVEPAQLRDADRRDAADSGSPGATPRVTLAADGGVDHRCITRPTCMVGGKIAAVGQRLLDSVSRMMLRQGLEAMSAELDAPPGQGLGVKPPVVRVSPSRQRSTEALALLARAPGRQAARGRTEPDPRDELPAGGARRCWWTSTCSRSWPASGETAEGGLRIGAMTRHQRGGARAAGRRAGAAAGGGHAVHRPPPDPDPRHRGRQPGPRRSGRRAPRGDGRAGARRWCSSEHGGERRVPADEFFTGLFATALEPGELLTGIEMPPLPAAHRLGVPRAGAPARRLRAGRAWRRGHARSRGRRVCRRADRAVQRG